MASTRIDEHIGRVLGDRYRLLAAIGLGSSAHVFLADDVRLRRRVAVKILHPALADDQAFLRRFRAEAQAAAALNHPNIMSVFDWGEEADGPFLVCEYLGGGSLRTILDKGDRLSPSQALMVGLEAARGLDYAHRRGFVHRDIKPANLLFDEDGRLRIADFGLARALAEAAWTEPSGAVLGTARYAAPELVQGAEVDGRADVYSLAVTLVESVTGRVPFAADTTVATLLGRLERPLPAPPELGPMGPVVARAGRPIAAERLDAVALGAALQAIAPELPSPEPLPLVGPAGLDDAVVPDRDPTDIGAARGAPSSDADPTLAGPAMVEPTVVAPVVDQATDAPTLVQPAEAKADEAGPSVPRSAGPLGPSVPRSAGPLGPSVPRSAGPLGPPRQGAAKRRRRRWPWVVLGAVVVLLIAAVASYAVVQAQIPTHPVPNEVNKPLAEARAALVALKFDVAVRSEFVDGTEPGQVTDQNPKDGTLKEGRTVTLTVSKGPTPVGVPDLAGLSQDAATAKLHELRLEVGAVTPRSDEQAPEGQVLDWAPKGVTIPRGGTVDLAVSSGPALREVPDLSGEAYDDAAAALRNKGLEPSKSEVYSDASEGTVVSTSPKAGASVERGSKVTVNVSKGQPVVPSLSGLSVSEATSRLQAIDLEVGGAYGPPGGKVFFQTPPSGTKVKAGTKVSLFIV